MGSWCDGFISNGIHFTRTGGDGPPLVLAHGFTDSGLCWTRTAKALEADYDVIMPDARGHGQSAPAETRHSAEDLGHDLAALIAELGLGSPAVIGHSMGAATAFAAAVGHPDLVGAIVMVDPPWHSADTQPRGKDHRDGWRRQTEVDKTLFDNDLRERIRKEGPGWDAVDIETKLQAIRQLDIRIFDFVSLPLRSWSEALPRVKCPALLVWAEHGIVDEDTADAARELAPDLAVERIADSGHSIQRDQFDAYLRVVRRFLDRLG
jgi:pimeloyl-ACP methyl ester carboxylesterase